MIGGLVQIFLGSQMSIQPFTVPEAVVRKASIRFGLVGIVGLTMGTVINGGFHWQSSAISAGVVLGIIVLGYFSTQRHVWVLTSLEGLHGPGSASRKITIPWHEAMVVKDANEFFIGGVAVYAERDSGFLRVKASSIFIPAAILESEEFQAAVSKYAAPSNALLKRSRNAV